MRASVRRAARTVAAVALVVTVTAVSTTAVAATDDAEPRRPHVAATSIAIPPADQVLAGIRTDHPRLILTPDRVTALQQRLASDPTTAALYAPVKARVQALLATPPVTYDKPDGIRLLEVSRTVVRRMYDLGLVYLVEGDPAVAARGWQELAAVSAFPDWNPLHFLDTAEMTHGVAIGYDWLHAALTPAQRSTVVEALRTKGLTPAAEAYRGNLPLAASFWTIVDHNWNNVVNGGEVIGALAVADVHPALASEVAHGGLTRLPAALTRYAPDGGWFEGVGYWEYATEYTVYTLAALDSALGRDFGLSTVDGLDRTGDVPIHMTGPTGQRFNWADDGEPRGAPPAPFAFWLAERYGHESYRAYQLGHAEPAALDVVWYQPSAGPAEVVPGDRLFAGIDVVTSRTAWDDPSATWVGAKGGDAGANHNQLDLGSFVLDAQGERWAVDLGKDNYNLPGYFQPQPGGPRWSYYRNRAEGHNTLVLDPDACEDQDPRALATVTRFEAAADGMLSVIDLTNAYRGTPARRGIARFADGRVVVQDELGLDAADPTELWWFVHTRADILVDADGRSATLTQNGKVLRARLDAPPGASFTVTDPLPLPGAPTPAGNAANPGIRRLTVHLPAATGATTLAVTFDDGSDPDPTSVAPLDQWSLASPLTQQVRRPAVARPLSANPCKGIAGPEVTPPQGPSDLAAPAPAPAPTPLRPAFTG